MFYRGICVVFVGAFQQGPLFRENLFASHELPKLQVVSLYVLSLFLFLENKNQTDWACAPCLWTDRNILIHKFRSSNSFQTKIRTKSTSFHYVSSSLSSWACPCDPLHPLSPKIDNTPLINLKTNFLWTLPTSKDTLSWKLSTKRILLPF